jgi:hypothetical protein
VRRKRIRSSRRDPLNRQNPRSCRNLATLAGGYALTGAAFLVAVQYASQHDYGGVAFGVCSGVFFGLGCVLLTLSAIQGPIRPVSPASPTLESENDVLTRELVERGPVVPTGAFVYKLLPYNTCELSLDVGADPASVASFAKDILEEEGHLLAAKEMPEAWQVKGVVGVGWGDMNVAIVTISISKSETNHTHITIQGKSKEYLIRQHGGEKAAQKIAQQLKAQLAG